MKPNVTKEQLVAGLHVVKAIAEAIRESGSIPSGILYAQCMGNVDLEGYNRILDMLIRAELVSRDVNHMLRWIGPQIEAAA